MNFIVDCFNSDPDVGDPDLNGLLTVEYTRDLLRQVNGRSVGLLSDSSKIWKVWAEWEHQQLAICSDK